MKRFLRSGARWLDGSYDKPFVLENGGLRALHFGHGFVQSVIGCHKMQCAYLRQPWT
ncbi:hypothetical protein [Thauera aromatica]|uniref:hypothetical protein n=1 Tax=Thauera aromatica TaxID=59405 RepID=UPI001FFDCB99|nr:hypothetical protein [Thauera aromatica]MCK2096073.1 hypothetical protein [Thauera aromatica]